MDSLLASYGSDEDDEQEEGERPSEVAGSSPAVSVVEEPPRKLSLFGRLPPPKSSGAVGSSVNSGSLFGSIPSPQFEQKKEVVVKRGQSSLDTSLGDGEGGKMRSSLFGKLPPPKLEEPGTGFGNPIDEIVSTKSSLFVALPPPKVEFDSSNVKFEMPSSTGGSSLFGSLPPHTSAGNSNPNAKKQPVTFRPPIDMSVFDDDDDDDDWKPAQKKVKAEPNAMGGGGLKALLPAPNNSLGVGATLRGGPTSGGRRAAMEVVARTATQDVELKAEPEAVDSRIATASRGSPVNQNEAPVNQAQMQYDNSAYAADQSVEFAPQVQYANEPYGWAAPQPAYAPPQELVHPVHNINGHYEQQNSHYNGNVSSYMSQSSQASYSFADAGPVDPVAQVLQAERRRGKEDRISAPAVIEVKQADLTGSKLREDQLCTTGIAFGPSYLPVSSSKDKPSKLHRRKHQIGSLLHDMKAREMELLDRRAKGNMTKAETQAKYGW